MPASTPDALSELARIWRRYEGDPDGAIRVITETGCRALGVERCSVWLLDDDHERLRCIDLYESEPARHSSGIALAAADYPAYFAALEAEEPIAADDAHTDNRTREFSAGYLTPLGIGAMLDAPLRLGLELRGVICHEHVGPGRAWTRAEQKDAAFLASLTSLALELGQRAKREALLAATLESTGEGIVAIDGDRIVAHNRRFLEMWGLTEAPTRLSLLRRHMDAVTSPMGRYLADATDILAGWRDDDVIDMIELADGRVFERTSRPQMLGDQMVGRVWSFRDISGKRRAEEALRASEVKMRELAIRDGLTGLFNRRYALEQLILALERGEHSGEPIAVALIDVDHFKRINDGYGHLVGDAVLRDLSRLLGDRLRGTDTVGRYGGEEFVVVFRRAGAREARGALEKIRVELAERRDNDGVPPYTFSAGVAELPADGQDATALLSRADERLYQAKEAGRNRIL